MGNLELGTTPPLRYCCDHTPANATSRQIRNGNYPFHPDYFHSGKEKNKSWLTATYFFFHHNLTIGFLTTWMEHFDFNRPATSESRLQWAFLQSVGWKLLVTGSTGYPRHLFKSLVRLPHGTMQLGLPWQQEEESGSEDTLQHPIEHNSPGKEAASGPPGTAWDTWLTSQPWHKSTSEQVNTFLYSTVQEILTNCIQGASNKPSACSWLLVNIIG